MMLYRTRRGRKTHGASLRDPWVSACGRVRLVDVQLVAALGEPPSCKWCQRVHARERAPVQVRAA